MATATAPAPKKSATPASTAPLPNWRANSSGLPTDQNPSVVTRADGWGRVGISLERPAGSPAPGDDGKTLVAIADRLLTSPAILEAKKALDDTLARAEAARAAAQRAADRLANIERERSDPALLDLPGAEMGKRLAALEDEVINLTRIQREQMLVSQRLLADSHNARSRIARIAEGAAGKAVQEWVDTLRAERAELVGEIQRALAPLAEKLYANQGAYPTDMTHAIGLVCHMVSGGAGGPGVTGQVG
jgi:flagellar biosynthesis/type III secretory pathway chaperone